MSHDKIQGMRNMRTYIQVHLQDDDPAIIRAIRHGIRLPLEIKDGDPWICVRSPEEIMAAGFDLGLLNAQLSEQYRILNPFMLELVNVEDEE